MVTRVFSVCDLFTKPASGRPMVAPHDGQIFLKKGLGINGDINSNAYSPRQVLVVRREDLLELNIRPGELRENIIVEGMGEDVFTPGAILRLGSEARIRLTFYCEPCKRISHVVSALKILESRRGILGVVLAGGFVARGDSVAVERQRLSPLSPVPFERFLAFTSAIPRGRVSSYRQVVTGVGVAESYMRAMPRYISKASLLGYPVHRIVDSSGNLVGDNIDHQKQELEREGVEVVGSHDLFNAQAWYYVEIEKYGININLGNL